MKIHWLSNAAWGGTGYSNQTRVFLPRLQALGHELSMTAFWGLEGAPLTWKGIKVYPRGNHLYGQDIAGANAAHAKADILISLMDAWVCEPRLYGDMPWVPWFPVDSEPLSPRVREQVNQAFARIVYSKFATKMMDDAGLNYHYVPHGVDTSVYHERENAREYVHFPKDRYIVGMVAANKGNPSRKAFVENITAFAQFQKKHPDAWLYLHTSTSENGENAGVNLVELIGSLGMVRGRDYQFCDQYNYLVSYSDEYMAHAYSAMDVHLLVSMGEGFGIPILEAQACGTPVIVGDWTSMPELCFSGWKIPKTEAAPFWTPLAAYQYIPRIGAIVDALEMAYHRSTSYRKDAVKGARLYDAERVTEKYWKPTLETIATQVEDSKRERKWAKIGVNLGDGALHLPSLEKDDPAELRVYSDGRKMVHPEGFEMEFNGVKLDIEDDPEGGVSKVVMKEIANTYDLDRDFKDGDVIVDIGAHVGVVSCYLGKKYPQTKIYAFEPNRTNYNRLIGNIAVNKATNVSPSSLAVTKDGRNVSYGYDTAKNSGGNSIYAEYDPSLANSANSTTLDRIFQENDIDRIRLLKIDCEGAEYEIIEANPELLKRVDAVRGELHPRPGKSMQELHDLIKSYVPDTKLTFLGGGQ